MRRGLRPLTAAWAKRLALLLVLALLGGVATAGAAERRVALVIGNSGYTHVPLLANPRNDAEAIAGALRRVGFDTVELAEDLGRAGFVGAIQAFARDAHSADVALVFYAGHGIELGGRNFLIPTDAKLASDLDVDFEAIPLDLVMRAVEGAKRLRIVLLDACRNNPFAQQMTVTAGSGRSLGRGLARIEPPGDMLVAYAARDGQVAADGTGTNSPYTTALLQHIETPGLEIQFMFRKVRDAVLESTGNRQQPHEYGSLGGDPFYFVPPAPVVTAPAVDPALALELAFWRSIEDSGEPAELEDYLRQFPDGTFAGLARRRLAALTVPSTETEPDAPQPVEPIAVTPPTVEPASRTRQDVPRPEEPGVAAPSVVEPPAMDPPTVPIPAPRPILATAPPVAPTPPKAAAGSTTGAGVEATAPTRLNNRRCGDILQRVQLGEPLTDADRTFLQRDCRS